MNSAFDASALLLAVGLAVGITAVLGVVGRGETGKRGWAVASALAVALFAVGMVDLLRETPRETHAAGIVLGAALPVSGAMMAIRGTRRVRPGFRWPIVCAVTFGLLFGGLLLGAAVLPRFLPF